MKLRILCLNPAVNTTPDAPILSYAVRELGATLHYYAGNAQRLDLLTAGCDVAVYYGVYGGPDLPSVAAFHRARATCGKLVGMFSDAGCPDGTSLYERYRDEDVFSVTVNLDGNPNWPKRVQDWTAFGLFDTQPYERELPRVRDLGFRGAPGDPAFHHRAHVLKALGKWVSVVVRGEKHEPYKEYVDWMLGCRAIVNDARTGSGRALHVKGRVTEAALAGCLLFETKDSPTRMYLTPGVDYLEYKSPAEIIDVLRQPNFSELAAEFGKRAKAKVLREYGPKRFWDRITK